MPTFTFVVTDSAQDGLADIERQSAKTIDKFFEIASDIERNGLRSHYVEKIKGTKNGWKFTFGNNYKALLTCDDAAKVKVWLVFRETKKSDYDRPISKLMRSGIFRKK